MRKFVLVLSILAIVPFAQLHAEEGEKMDGSHPCHKIKAACEAAGFKMGAHKEGNKKGVMMDCMRPLMKGEKVEGVSVSEADLKACKEKKEARHHKKKSH